MNNRASPEFYTRAYIAALCMMPIIAMIAPRFTGLGPPLIAVAGILLYYFSFRRWPQFSRRAFMWAIIFPALMAFSALWSQWPDSVISRTVKTIPVLLSGAVLWSLSASLDEKAAVHFRKYFPLAVILSGAICALELYDQGPLYHFTHMIEKEDGFNLSPINRSVVVFVLCLFPAFSCLVRSDYTENRKNIFLALLAAVAGFVLYATNSQSAQLAFGLGLVIALAFPFKQKWAWIVTGVLLTALLCATPWITQFLFHHLVHHVSDYAWLKKSYANQRLEIWDFVSRRALEKPLLGHGVEAARNIKDFDSAKLFWPTTKVLHPHNFAVQIWIEFGALGALVVSLFFADLLRQMQKLEARHARILLPLFIASISVAATGYGLWQGWWLGMFCLLFGYAGLLLKDNSPKRL